MAQREQTLLDYLRALAQPAALIIEGFPGPLAHALAALPQLHIIRLAPACLCCDGNQILRVQLQRLLRSRIPCHELLIAPARVEHLPALRAQLQQPQYDGWLSLQHDLQAT